VDRREILSIRWCEKNDGGLGIPYPAQKRPDGENHGYLDLKRHPALIKLVPEIQGWPELELFLSDINLPTSIFRTLGCEVGSTQLRNGNTKITSYNDIAFEILEWNHRDAFVTLWEKFQLYTKDYSNTPAKVEFELQQASYNDHRFQGLNLTIWNHGYGETGNFARERWASGLTLVKIFLRAESDKFGGELEKGHKTIS